MVDAHVHFWNPKQNYYPWLNDRPLIPFRYGDYSAICRPYLPDDYKRDAKGHNIVKTVYIEAEWDPTVQHGNDRLFWCQHTYNCLGPDGRVVDEEECTPSRECYKAL